MLTQSGVGHDDALGRNDVGAVGVKQRAGHRQFFQHFGRIQRHLAQGGKLQDRVVQSHQHGGTQRGRTLGLILKRVNGVVQRVGQSPVLLRDASIDQQVHGQPSARHRQDGNSRQRQGIFARKNRQSFDGIVSV